MRTPSVEPLILHVDTPQTASTERRIDQRARMVRRMVTHIGVFFVSFIFTTGVAVLSILLWVRPDELFALVLSGLFSSLVFVATFSALRLLVLHRLLDEYPDKEDDPGFSHHTIKSVVYAIIALIIALLVVGLIVNLATAGTPT